ncbi:hypothetical protein LCER1_G000618, partial [Lachnellula cervina]
QELTQKPPSGKGRLRRACVCVEFFLRHFTSLGQVIDLCCLGVEGQARQRVCEVMQLPPPEVLAALPKPNYVDPVTRGDAKVIVNVVLFTILLSFLGLRIYTRTYLRKFFGTDDILILVALIPTSVFFIISVLADTKFHWTRHSNDIPLSEIPRGLKIVLCTELMFAAACTLTKLSMFVFTYRLLSSSRRLWRRVTSTAIAVVSLQGGIFCISVIFQCRPPSHYFRVTIDSQPECINETWSLLVAGIINTFTDFVAVALPIRTVLSLQLQPKQIFPIVVLFCFGFLSCCCGIVRTYYTYKVSTSYDQVWDSYPVWITAALELYIGIICASIPATKPFFSTILPHIFGTIDPISGPSAYNYASASASRQLNHSRSAKMSSPDTEAEHGEELLNLEKALGSRNDKGVAFSTTTITGGRGESETEAPEEYLRIRQTVDYVMGQGRR